jgi:hypothetical protein
MVMIARPTDIEHSQLSFNTFMSLELAIRHILVAHLLDMHCLYQLDWTQGRIRTCSLFLGPKRRNAYFARRDFGKSIIIGG